MPQFHRCVGVGLNTQLADWRRRPGWVESEAEKRSNPGGRDHGERQGQTPGPLLRHRRRQGLGRYPFEVLAERVAQRDHRSRRVDLRRGISAGLAQPRLVGSPPDLLIKGAQAVSYPVKSIGDTGYGRGDARRTRTPWLGIAFRSWLSHNFLGRLLTIGLDVTTNIQLSTL